MNPIELQAQIATLRNVLNQLSKDCSKLYHEKCNLEWENLRLKEQIETLEDQRHYSD